LSRKLAVIVHADIVGSTTLVQQDEAIAHERMRSAFQGFSAIIASYGGKTRELRGDALVAEFHRPSDAVTAALAFQHANKAHNGSLDDDIRPQLRIGISLGEVIVADGTVTGAGVVLAQRLEQLAAADGVVVQGSVAETVPSRMPFDFENLGEQNLKGFEQPIRAFAASLRPGQSLPASEVIEAVPKAEPARRTFAGKPSIAVLPFDNLSNDPEQDYFADGIVEDIITALSHIRQWHVVARNSSFAYKGQSVDVRDVAAKLGVRYVLEGSVRKAGNRLRITGQLIDADSGTHLWAERFDGDLADVFELQDQVTESVVGAIEPSLRLAEIERSKRKPPGDMDAYDLYLRALPQLHAMRPAQNEEALNLLHRAVELDPNYAPALAFLAWAYEERLTRDWGAYGDDDSGTAVAMARRAIAADRNDALVLVISGFVLIMIARDYEQGLQVVNRARELNPNIAFVGFMIGASLIICGEPEEGLACVEAAIRVSPGDPGAFFFYASAALAHLCCGRPAEACELATRSARIYPDWDTTYRVLASALAQLDRLDEARTAVARLRELAPNLTVSGLRRRWPLRDTDTLERILDGLRRAGLPE
jgi:TolB-like protein/class 3 adenylate cyclase/Flp pilus assembly protein TadD